MTRTKKGYELAQKLHRLPNMQNSRATELCSKICRHATSLHRLAEINCNQGLTPAQEKRDDELEQLVIDNVKYLSQHTGVEIRAIFNGDPRGPAVKLQLPEEHRVAYDCFGGEGVCVP